MEPGIKGKKELVVTREITAEKAGSGLLPVFATPIMIATMEGVAASSVAPYLEEGKSTVGTLVNVKHLAATPIGMKVTCETELTEVEGRKLVFSFRAYDEKGPIGEGNHERFIIDVERFMAKAQAKLGGGKQDGAK